MTIKLNTRAIKKLMAEYRMNNATLSVLSGVGESTLSAILRRGTCADYNARLIASALNVEVAEIWKEE